LNIFIFLHDKCRNLLGRAIIDYKPKRPVAKLPGGVCLNQFHSGNFASSRPTPTGVICFVIECERLQPDYAWADEYACARSESGGSRRSGNDR